MFRHRPSCLEGPVSRGLGRWSGPNTLTRAAKRGRDNPGTVDLRAATPGIRVELVARVRRAIALGQYDTPEKWEAALERLFTQLEAQEPLS